MPAFGELHDSGARQQFSTGAHRDTAEGKGRYDLLQVLALRRVAVVLEKGAKKYDPRNWEQGMPLSRFLDSALRHAFEYLEGRRDEDHAAQAAWNLLCLIQTEEMIERGLLPAELNDLPNYVPEAEPAVLRIAGGRRLSDEEYAELQRRWEAQFGR